MQLPPDLIAELIVIMRERFGAELTAEDATEIGGAFVELYHPISQLKN